MNDIFWGCVMKRTISFYIAWDILFLLSLYIFYRGSIWIKDLAMRSFCLFDCVLPVLIILSMIIGAVFSVLIIVSSRFEMTKKIAVAEFLLVGLPAFYISSFLYISFLLMRLLHMKTMPILTPIWLVHDNTPIIIGSMLFAYELIVFITRLVRIKKSKT